MKGKTIFVVVITCLTASAQFLLESASCQPTEQPKEPSLQVYIPREATIQEDTIKLGRACIIRGDEALVARASEITLGRIAVPSQTIVIERSVVLSRLVCNGIPASSVTLTGAEKIAVERQRRVIKGDEFVKLASSFLKKNLSGGSVCQSTPVWTPKDFIVPGAGKVIKLSPRSVKSGARGHVKVRIAVLVDGKETGVREITFRLKYNCRRAVALAEILAGDIISPENVKIERTVSSYPEPANWRPPYGLVARRRLPKNIVIRPDMVGPVRPAKVVKRNQTVVIRVEKPGLLVTSLGTACQEGCVGEFIKVRNINSQRIILGRVSEDGSVEPVL
jgi:flagella basal body P-ring formation protein FlgA